MPNITRSYRTLLSSLFVSGLLISCGGGGGGSRFNDTGGGDGGGNNTGNPIAVSDTAQVNEDESISAFNVLSNDSDPNGDSLNLSNVTASVGTVNFTANGSVSYTPPQNFFGDVTVNYTVSDGGNSVNGTLIITVVPVNDPPTANNDTAAVPENAVDRAISVLSNDIDVDDTQLTITSANIMGNSPGTVDIQGQNLVFTPSTNFIGTVRVEYEIEDPDGETSQAELLISVESAGQSNNLLNTRSEGRPIVVSQQPRSASVDADPRDFNDWARFSSPANVNAPVISSDGSSVTFSRSSANDGANARDYLEFRFGPRYDDTNLSISMEVTAFTESASGNYGDSLHINGSNISGDVSRQATSTGIWATVLTVQEDSDDTVVRIGLGVNTNDTKTNSITIRNVQVSHLAPDDNQPNEYVDANGWLDAPGYNGATLPYAKDANYSSTTGLVSFQQGGTSDTPNPAHVMMVTDSYGAFLFGYTRQLFFGGVNDISPAYVMTIDTRAGRELEDISDGILLTEMYNIRGHENASPPGTLAVQIGVNSFLLDTGTTAALALTELQKYIDFAHARGMVALLATATPFKNSSTWTQEKQDELNAYNTAVRALDNDDNIRVLDINALIDTDADEIIDVSFRSPSSNPDFIHVSSAGNETLYNAYDQLIRDIIENYEPEMPPVVGIEANILASRTNCASPCTVVFSADKTRAEDLDEHGIWSQLIYHWDFDTGTGTPHNNLYSPTYTHVPGDTSREIGGPMATKTFLCDAGTCEYNVGVRAQDASGLFDDDFVTIRVNAESTQWSTSNTVCISNTLNTSDDWTAYGKPCPSGSTKRALMLNADNYDGKLVLLKKGDEFRQNIATLQGESNFKIGYFGNNDEARPILEGAIWLGVRSFGGDSNNPTSGSQNILNSHLDELGGFPANVTIDGLRIGTVSLGMSYSHIGMHDLDMDWESSNISNFGRIQLSAFNSLCTDSDNIDCDRVPFPKGAYISQVKLVGSETNAATVPQTDVGFNPVLNVAGIGCSMINYTGIVDASMRKVGEHNIRLMGWYRLNIMRSELLGQHGGPGKQKITTRSCIEKDVVNDSGTTDPNIMWQNRNDLPTHWRRDLEGRTRQDQWFNDGTDDYIKLSRYLVVQGNIIGDPAISGSSAGSTKVQTNVTSSNEDTMEDVLYTKNIFRDESGQDSTDISAAGFYVTCVDNEYSDSGTNCTPSRPDPRFGMRINPTPIAPPLAPGS